MDVPDGDERRVLRVLSAEDGPDFEDRGDFNAAIAFPLSPLSSHACCGRHAQNAAAGTETALTRRGQRWSGRRSPGWILPSGDAIQAGEVVHAEVASRVLDQSLAPHLDQFGADHGACRADEFRQVLMAQADVDRVAVSAALALEADQVTERGGHPGPDRRGELPE